LLSISSSQFFAANINKNDWVETSGSLRDMLGKAEYRKLISSTRESKMQGAPDGEYVILVYETDFKRKVNAQEIVVPMLDKDGKWRISGYHVD
jgi:fructose-1-phosphate kinase PfkB-like protein